MATIKSAGAEDILIKGPHWEETGDEKGERTQVDILIKGTPREEHGDNNESGRQRIY